MRQYLSGSACAAIAGAAMLLSFAAMPAHAQARGGSYLQSCSNVRTYNNRIVANCRRENGRWERTALNDVDSCVGDIANADGRLVCARRHGYGWNRHRGREGYGSSSERWNYGYPEPYRYNYSR